MSSAGNCAEHDENMTAWLNEKLSINEADGNKQNNNHSIHNCNRSNSSKYIAPMITASPHMCPSSVSNLYNNDESEEFNEICKKAQAGQKIMIIMRGAPGCGKSTMANTLLRQIGLLEDYNAKEFVFSSDDYFQTRRGYKFDRNLLPDAHDWNKNKVHSKAAAGWSPIIVDNTNIMVWEMQPYVQIAVMHGYLLEILEPQTSWCKSASKLSQRNVHQVPKENIQRMLDRYEKTSVAELLKVGEWIIYII